MQMKLGCFRGWVRNEIEEERAKLTAGGWNMYMYIMMGQKQKPRECVSKIARKRAELFSNR